MLIRMCDLMPPALGFVRINNGEWSTPSVFVRFFCSHCGLAHRPRIPTFLLPSFSPNLPFFPIPTFEISGHNTLGRQCIELLFCVYLFIIYSIFILQSRWEIPLRYSKGYSIMVPDRPWPVKLRSRQRDMAVIRCSTRVTFVALFYESEARISHLRRYSTRIPFQVEREIL